MTLRDLLVTMGASQAPIVTNLVKALGILETAEVGFSSDYLKHEYEIMAEDAAATVRSVNGSIVATGTRSVTASIQLPSIELLIELDKAIARKWGSIQRYLDDPIRSQSYIRSILQKMSTALIYGDNSTFGVAGTFKGLHQIAKANSNVIAQLGGSTGSNTSIFAVHWMPGETQIVIPQENNSELVQFELVGGGTLQAPTSNTTTKARDLVYGANFWANGAIQLGSNYSVAAITQIDDSHKPTAAQIDKLVDAVKGMADGSTFIYVNRRSRRFLKELKNSKLSISPNETGYNTVVSDWDSIPVVLEESILDTETSVLD